jgi:hypothetical protein
MLLNGTVAPWLIGGFAVLALAMLAQTLKAWREAKRSPYFFLRVQAQKRLRQYSTSALVLISLATATAAYGWEQPQDETPRVAILVNNKPDTAISNTITQTTDEPAPFLILDPTSSLIDRPATPGDTPTSTITSTESAILLLPTEYNQVASTASLQDDTTLGTLFFSTAVDDQYKAINPGRTYSEGFFTLYGTFDYDGMENGMAWSWVWMRDGKVLSGGNELWNYGNDGPGYVFLNPEEGFATGQYTLGIWVNGKLMAESNFQITTSAASQR